MKYEVTIVSNDTKFVQVVEAQDEHEALSMVNFVVFECFDEYILTVKEYIPVNLFFV